MVRSGFTCFLFVLPFLFCVSVHCEELREKTLVDTKETSEQESLSLPDISVSGVQPVRIDAVNVASYSHLFVRELVPLVESGELALSAADKLPFDWRVDDDWLRTTMNETPLSFTPKGVLQQSGVVARGFPFRISLNAREGGGEADPSAGDDFYAQKVLLNSLAHYWSLGALQARFTLLTFAGQKLESEYGGTLRRVFPARFSEKYSQQLFREIVELTLSPTFSPLRWLTFRFLSPQEDLVWTFSPALQKVRRITGVNRSDSLYGSVLSLDDFFTWSGATQDVDLILEQEQTLLVPFRYKDQLPLVKTEEGCDMAGEDHSTTRRELLGRPLEWNFESRKYLGAAPWVPSYAVYYPRTVHRLTLQSQSPYQSYARQVLYIDKELMLPVYKVVYDTQGKLWKIVFSVFSQATTSDRKTKMSVPEFTVVIDRQAKKSSVLDYASYALCLPGEEQKALTAFGPTKIDDPAKEEGNRTDDDRLQEESQQKTQ